MMQRPANEVDKDVGQNRRRAARLGGAETKLAERERVEKEVVESRRYKLMADVGGRSLLYQRRAADRRQGWRGHGGEGALPDRGCRQYRRSRQRVLDYRPLTFVEALQSYL